MKNSLTKKQLENENLPRFQAVFIIFRFFLFLRHEVLCVLSGKQFRFSYLLLRQLVRKQVRGE